MRVIVAGGGVAGLALGHGLKKYGIDVVVLESRPDLATTGYRLHMNADGGNALRFLLTPEAYRAYEETSRANPRRHVFAVVDSALGEVAARPHLGAPNDRLVAHTAVNRLTLREILASTLGDSLRFSSRVAGFEESSEGVTVMLEDGSRIEGDVLVAAEGMRSPVRSQRLGPPVFRDTGESSIYSRVGYDALADLDLPPVLDDGFIIALDAQGREVTFGPFRPRRSISAVGEELLSGELTAVDPYLQVTVSVPSSGDFAFVGDIRTAGSSELHAHMLQHVSTWSPTVRALFDRIDARTTLAVPIMGIETTPAWTPSHVTVVGDAVHGMPPTLGAGANTALRDAAQLVEHLLRVSEGGDLVQEIGAYEAEMRAYAYPVANAAHDPRAKSDATFTSQPWRDGKDEE